METKNNPVLPWTIKGKKAEIRDASTPFLPLVRELLPFCENINLIPHVNLIIILSY
jgi:hypothetical protein